MLNHRQQAFIYHYLSCWQGAEAARRAGYSERRAKQTASELLKDPGVAAAVEAELGNRRATAAENLERLTAQARGDMADIAAELGYPKLREARDAGRLDTRTIRKLRFHPPRGPNERPALASIEVYSSQDATTTLLKISGDLEDRIRIVYERSVDEFFTAIISEFRGEGDETTLDRIERVIAVHQARNG